MPNERIRNLVIGTGEGGKSIAWHLGSAGEPTIAVERGHVGGACPNVACLPSKNYIYSAKVASLWHRANEFGLPESKEKLEMPAIFRRKQQMVVALRHVHLDKFAASKVELVLGEARFVEERTVQIALADGRSRTITADRVFLNLGTRAAIPNIPGLAEAKPLTHVEALSLSRIPEHLVVLGGGYVGLELAQAYRRFGSRVTIIQRAAHLLENEDADVTDAMLQLMKEEGLEVRLQTELVKVTGRSGEKLHLTVRGPNGESAISPTDILVATGRTPNTDRIDLSKTGVELDERGYVRVNEKLETTASSIWALGDCAGSPAFTHVAYDDFRVVRDNLAGTPRTTIGRLIPSVLFTDPELARVGLNETQAKENQIPYRLAKIPMLAVLRSRTLSETRGFVKALIDDTDQIIGFTAFGIEASELLAAIQTAMVGKLPYTLLRESIYAHPTVSDSLSVLFSSVSEPGL